MNSASTSQISMTACSGDLDDRVGEGCTKMPPLSKRGCLTRGVVLVEVAARRLLHVLSARNALEVDRFDLGSPDCMGAEAWVRDVEAEEVTRSSGPATTDIQRIHAAERQFERDISRHRAVTYVLVAVMAIGLIALVVSVSSS